MEANNKTIIYGKKRGVKLSFCTWDSNMVETFTLDRNGKGSGKTEKIFIDLPQQDFDFELACHFINVLDRKTDPDGQ